MALGALLGASQFAGSAIQSLAGLGSNPEHEANKRRVRDIDLLNQEIQGDNLKINTNYKNTGARVPEQFDNIRLAGAQNRGRSRLMLDRAANEAAVANQGDFIKMMQQQGYRPGQMNLNRSTAADMSRRAASRASKLTDSNEDFITNNFINSLGEQNQIKQTYEQVAVKPQYKQYITGYTPQKSNQTAKMLNFAGSLMGDAVSAMGTFNKFKKPTDLNEFDPSKRGFDSSKISIFDYFKS